MQTGKSSSFELQQLVCKDGYYEESTRQKRLQKERLMEPQIAIF